MMATAMEELSRDQGMYEESDKKDNPGISVSRSVVAVVRLSINIHTIKDDLSFRVTYMP